MQSKAGRQASTIRLFTRLWKKNCGCSPFFLFEKKLEHGVDKAKYQVHSDRINTPALSTDFIISFAFFHKYIIIFNQIS